MSREIRYPKGDTVQKLYKIMSCMDRTMMAWFAVFQYKNEGTSNEARDLKETKGGGSQTVGSSSVKFLVKGCHVHKKSMWIQSKTRQVLS